MSFCHCHLHGEFSLLDGCGKAEDYAARAQEIGQEAVALTDHGNLCGALYHAEACHAAGLKPIVGMEAYFEPILGEARAAQDRQLYHHLLLIAKNEAGFKNLMRLSSAAFQPDRFYYNPIIDWDLLARNCEGLIATSTCISGYIPQLILGNRPGDVDEAVEQFKATFGDGNFYMEIQPHDFPEQHTINKEIVALAKKHGLPLVATIDTHYPDQDWMTTQDTVILLATGSDLKKREMEVKIAAEKGIEEMKEGDRIPCRKCDGEAEIVSMALPKSPHRARARCLGGCEERGKDLEWWVPKYVPGGGKTPMRAYPTTWMMSEEEVRAHFAKMKTKKDVVDEAIANTMEIAEACKDFNYDKSPKVPKATQTPEEARELLERWCEEGLERIGKSDDEEYRERMKMELDMFQDKGVLDYFVIIADIVRWAKSDKPLPSEKEKNLFAKKRPIRVGAGRGSAGASLVLYLTRVTAMDPIGYDLLFARFMSPARAEMPDVDIDFQHDRRDEVAQYIIDKYGRKNVAHVAAFQSFGMKSVIQAVGRAHNIDFVETKKASDTLDDEAIGTMLEDVVDQPGHEALAAWKKNNKAEWEIALKLENQIRGMSKHAAAVVVTDRPVDQLMPTMRVTGIKVIRGEDGETKDNAMVTQWSARANAELIATYGFLKIDLLVTVGLTVQQAAIDLINERHGIVVDFEDPTTHPEVALPVGEQEVCERFAHGSNLGVFQFGSAGIRRALADVKPTTLDDLIAVNAMFRPGPMQNIGTYARRKNGLEEWSIPEKAVPVFGKTYGVLTYQEQVMQAFIVLAGVDATQADIARKVVGKGVARDIDGKKKLEKLHKEWTAGCKANGMDMGYAEELFEFMLQMATYSFNRAHAAGYALQAYQDQWLRTHYPIEFYSSLMTHDPPKKDDTIREARATGIEILPPDINDSDKGFTLHGDSILFGLCGVKNVGDVAANVILGLRDPMPFGSFDDFDKRIVEAKVKAKVNSKVRDSLVGAGAMDRWDAREEWTDEEKAEMEKELLGFSPSRPSDLVIYKDMLEEHCDLHDLNEALDEDRVNVAGEITAIKRKSKRGRGGSTNSFAFITLWYEGDEVETFWWSDQLEQHDDILEEGQAILVHGIWQEEKRSIKVLDAMTVRDFAERLEVAA